MRGWISTVGVSALAFLLLSSLDPSNLTLGVSPTLNQWNGLVVGQSSPVEALRLLGDPRKDSRKKLKVVRIQDWITPDRRKRVWRTLEYRKLQADDREYKKVLLYFRDQRMMVVHLETRGENRIVAQSMPLSYRVRFYALRFESLGHREGSGIVDDKGLTRYALVAATPQVFVSAEVKVPMFSAGRREDVKLPGYVETLQIISRSVENPDVEDPIHRKLTELVAPS